MSPALRRSRRSKSSSYSVGDLVEIKRRSRSYTGRLVYRLTEDRESPNPLWLVTFDEGNVKDEEIYEKHFGAILKKGKSSRSAAGAKEGSGSGGDKPKRRGAGRGGSSGGDANSNVSSSSSDDNQAQEGSAGGGVAGVSRSGRGGRRAGGGRGTSGGASSSNSPPEGGIVGAGPGDSLGAKGDSPAASAISDSSGAPLLAAPTERGGGRRSAAPPSDSGDRLSAREQRSLRRQAKIDEAAVGDRRGNNKRGYGGGAVRSDDGKRARLDEADGECVKVKLLTGTLYLYKGLHRRAEFVRRY